MNRRYLLLMQAGFAWIAFYNSATCCAQAAVVPQGEEDAIRTTERAYIIAVRRGDADVIGKFWTPEGDYVDASGRLFKANDLAKLQPSRSAADVQEGDVALPDSTLRFISPAVAIEDGVRALGMSPDGTQRSVRFTAVWVKRDGRWLLNCLRESLIESISQSKDLKPLDWLVGEWAGTTDEAAVMISTYWSDSGDYLLRDFVMRRDDGETVTATERIGWDANNSEWISWTFDSQGGRGTGRWRQDGKRWFVEITDVLADGKRASTSAIYTPQEDGRFVWEVSRADLADEALPPIRVEFRRAVEIQ